MHLCSAILSNRYSIQYDTPPGASFPVPELQRDKRWREASSSRSRSRPPSRHGRSPSPRSRGRRRSDSISWSPSGRAYPGISVHGSMPHVPRASESQHARHRSSERSSHRGYNDSSHSDLRGRVYSSELRPTNVNHERSSGDRTGWESPAVY